MASRTGVVWPVVGRKDANRRIHAQNLIKEARLIKATSNNNANSTSLKGSKRAVPNATIISYLDSVIEYFDSPAAAVDNNDAVWSAIQQMQIDLKAQHEQQNASIHKLLSRGTSQSNTTVSKATSWASVAAGTATTSGNNPRTHVSSTSTAKASHLQSLASKEIRITITDSNIKENIQSQEKPSEFITQLINQTLTGIFGINSDTSHNINNSEQTTALGTATAKWVESARVMNSGDVYLYARTAAIAERMIIRRSEWEKFMGEGMRVAVPTYGIVVSSIPIRSIDMANQEDTISKIYSNNASVLRNRNNITKVRWLNKHKQGKNVNAIVVDLTSLDIANDCIQAGKMVWEGAPKTTQQYSKRAQITQCFNCYGFDHTARMCRAKTVCGFCSSTEHPTKEHVEPGNQSTHKCKNCHGKHTSWSKECKSHKQAVSKVAAEKRRILKEPLFRKTTTLSPSVSERGSRASTPAPKSPPTIFQTLVTDTEGDTDMNAPDAGVTINTTPQLPVSRGLFKDITYKATAGLQQSRFSEGFHTPKDMTGFFGNACPPTASSTPIAASSVRHLKNPHRKLVSSPVKPSEDGNTSDGYTIITRGKRAHKKHHPNAINRMKTQRLTESGYISNLTTQEEITESTAIAEASQLEGTGSAPESDAASGVSSSTSTQSSTVTSNDGSSVGNTTNSSPPPAQLRSSSRKH